MKKRLYLILSLIIIICLAYLLNFESVNDLTLKDSIKDKKAANQYFDFIPQSGALA